MTTPEATVYRRTARSPTARAATTARQPANKSTVRGRGGGTRTDVAVVNKAISNVVRYRLCSAGPHGLVAGPRWCFRMVGACAVIAAHGTGPARARRPARVVCSTDTVGPPGGAVSVDARTSRPGPRPSTMARVTADDRQDG